MRAKVKICSKAKIIINNRNLLKINTLQSLYCVSPPGKIENEINSRDNTSNEQRITISERDTEKTRVIIYLIMANSLLSDDASRECGAVV